MQSKQVRPRKGMQVRGRGGRGERRWRLRRGHRRLARTPTLGGVPANLWLGGPQQPGLTSLSSHHHPQAATNINTPRSIRSRLNFPRRKPAAPDTAAVPEAPQQQVVRSASGRMAMG